jgi:hypothetical protein
MMRKVLSRGYGSWPQTMKGSVVNLMDDRVDVKSFRTQGGAKKHVVERF